MKRAEAAVRAALHLMVAAALLAVVGSPAAWAAKADQEPTRITSDVMRVEQGGRRVVFSGNVLVVRPDMTIRSRTLTVHIPAEAADAAGPGSDGRIEKIVAEGDVRIERQGRTGSAAKATYFEDQGLLVMEGDPVLREGQSAVTGKVIRIWIRDGRSEVEGGQDKRVEAIFFTPKGVER